MAELRKISGWQLCPERWLGRFPVSPSLHLRDDMKDRDGETEVGRLKDCELPLGAEPGTEPALRGFQEGALLSLTL